MTAPGMLRAVELLAAAVLALLLVSGAPDVVFFSGFVVLLMIQLVQAWLTDKSSKRGLYAALYVGLIILVIAKRLWNHRAG